MGWIGGGGGGAKESAEARELYRAQAQIAREHWGLYKSEGLPQLRSLARQVDEMGSPAGIARAEGAATADVGRSYDTALAGLRSSMARYGLNPGSGKFTAGLRALALGRAADTAGARTTARVGLLDRALNARFGLASAWQGQAGLAMQGLGAAAGGVAGIGANKAAQRGQLWQGLGQLGGTLGAAWILSDRRLKRNIRQIGELHNGLRVYEFTYLDDPDTIYTGLMADEVEQVMPEFVGERGGYKAIAPFAILDAVARP